MTHVSSTRSSTPAQHTGKPGPARTARPAEQDVRAMGEALAKAGRQMAGDPRGGAALRKEGQPSLKEQARSTARDSGRSGTGNHTDALADPLRWDRDRQEREGGQGGGQSFGGQTAQPPVQVAVPTMPAPHVDPSAFAQMLADLWTRENGKGAKEVSVRFGDDAWPATGARLVRNAAGTLDIALLVGDRGQAYGDRLDGLQERLADAGVGVGALAIEADA